MRVHAIRDPWPSVLCC